jgi:hypothetical protein
MKMQTNEIIELKIHNIGLGRRNQADHTIFWIVLATKYKAQPHHIAEPQPLCLCGIFLHFYRMQLGRVLMSGAFLRLDGLLLHRYFFFHLHEDRGHVGSLIDLVCGGDSRKGGRGGSRGWRWRP